LISASENAELPQGAPVKFERAVVGPGVIGLGVSQLNVDAFGVAHVLKCIGGLTNVSKALFSEATCSWLIFSADCWNGFEKILGAVIGELAD
jgi:hypothetical protein